MYIRQVVLKNIRGFGVEQIELDLDHGDGEYAGWTVIAGCNGSGKTTLLRALSLAVVGKTAALRLQNSFEGWIHESESDGAAYVTIIPHPEDQFVGTGKRPSNMRLGLRWNRENLEQREPSIEHVTSTGHLSMATRGPWSDSAKGWLLAGYGTFRRLSGQAADAKRIIGGVPTIARLSTLFREDASLVEAVEWLRELRFRELGGSTWAADLLALALSLLNDGLLPDRRMRATHVDADGLWVRLGKNTKLQLRDLSGGYRAVCALLLDLLHCLYGAFGALRTESRNGLQVLNHGVVMIDEVDAHLHVSWQQNIGPWLKHHFPNIQFIVTSHSPFICQTADPRGLILLPAPGSSEMAFVADEALHRRVTQGPADAALLSKLFGMEHTWSDAAEAQRREFAALEAAVLAGTATRSQKTRYKTLRAEAAPSVEYAPEAVQRVLGAKPRRRT